MIRSFRDAETQKLFDRRACRRLPPDLHRSALRKLVILDGADSLADLRTLPGNRLEKLRGDRAGQYSIRINDQWRVCFSWRGSDAFDVEITDYH